LERVPFIPGQDPGGKILAEGNSAACLSTSMRRYVPSAKFGDPVAKANLEM
jgi:hypothetical protein